MWEGVRWRHRVTGGVVEIVEKFYGYVRVVELESGATINLDTEDILKEYIRLDPPRM